MGQMLEDIQYRLKESSSNLSRGAFKLFVGLVLGLTVSLVGQQMIGYGSLAFFLVIFSVIMAFHRISKSWTWSMILVFSLICVLIGLLLQMYILIAPGA